MPLKDGREGVRQVSARMDTVELHPIGFVHSPVKEPGHEDWQDVVSEIAVSPEFEPALEHVEDFSHLIVIYWMHLLAPAERGVLRVHPMRSPSLPFAGVFAARSPARPNPLGLTVVRLLERRGSVVRVAGLDAVDGTPVLDIKPYLPISDAASDVRVASWVHGRHLPAGRGTRRSPLRHP